MVSGSGSEPWNEVQTAMTAWLESARAHGDPIPAPRYRPAIYAAGRPAA
jgi:hypothetical protein